MNYREFPSGNDFFLIPDEEAWSKYKTDRWSGWESTDKFPERYSSGKPQFFPCIVYSYTESANRWQYDTGSRLNHVFLYAYEIADMDAEFSKK